MMKTFYVGIKAIIHDDERGYLMLRHSSGWLDLPGGRMDDNETFEETMKREISEELPGARLKNICELVGSTRVMEDIDPGISLVLLYYTAEVDLPDPIAISDEHTEYMWIKSLDDIESSDEGSENIRIIKKLLTK